MSRLTQRFLSELDAEWSHLPPAERESAKLQVAARLEVLVQAEAELGADVLEAQRRAVRAVGQECTLQPQTAVRLSPVCQVTLIWIAVKVVTEEVLRNLTTRPFPMSSSGGLVLIYLGGVGSGLIAALIATLVARLWHPRAALRGILYGLGILACFGMVSFFMVYFSDFKSFPPFYSRELLLRINLLQVLAMSLMTLATLLLAPKMTRKFRRRSL